MSVEWRDFEPENNEKSVTKQRRPNVWRFFGRRVIFQPKKYEIDMKTWLYMRVYFTMTLLQMYNNIGMGLKAFMIC